MSGFKFHEVSIIGSPILDLNRFYECYDSYQEFKKNNSQIPYYLYSFNIMDSYLVKFENNLTLNIMNKNTKESSKFYIGEYIKNNFFLEKNSFGVSEIRNDDLELNIKGNLIKVFASGNLEKILKDHYHFRNEIMVLFENKIHLFFKFVNFIFMFYNEQSLLKYSFKEIERTFIQLQNEIQVQNDTKELTEGVFSFFKEEIQHDINISYVNCLVNLIWKLVRVMEPTLNAASIEDLDHIQYLLFKYTEKIFPEDLFLELKKISVIDLDYSTVFEIKNEKVKILEIKLVDLIGRIENENYFSNSKINKVVLENFYIGKAFGSDGERNAFDRIGKGHEKLQRLLTEIGENKELAIVLFTLKPKNGVVFMGNDPSAKERLEELLKTKTDEKNIVDLTEIALITYFKPKLNTQHVKNEFKSLYSKQIEEIISKNDGVVINMDFENCDLVINSSAFGNNFSSRDDNIIQFRFNKNIDFKDINTFEDLLEKLN